MPKSKRKGETMRAIITKDAGNGYFPECGTNHRIVTPVYKRETSIVRAALNFTGGRCYCRIEYFTDRDWALYGKPYKTVYIF